jgi:hypothetical protein
MFPAQDFTKPFTLHVTQCSVCLFFGPRNTIPLLRNNLNSKDLVGNTTHPSVAEAGSRLFFKTISLSATRKHPASPLRYEQLKSPSLTATPSSHCTLHLTTRCWYRACYPMYEYEHKHRIYVTVFKHTNPMFTYNLTDKSQVSPSLSFLFHQWRHFCLEDRIDCFSYVVFMEVDCSQRSLNRKLRFKNSIDFSGFVLMWGGDSCLPAKLAVHDFKQRNAIDIKSISNITWWFSNVGTHSGR